MAELDPSIIFRQEKYSGPTQDELDAKQNMNALRNMLGAGQSIDSPEVINAMMALDPDMGLKLQSNASTMQTNAAAAQKSIADARAKDREARLAEVDRYFPVGMAIAQAGDQEGWDQFGTFLGQKFGPEALMGYPRDVKQAGTYLQDYLTAKQQFAAKGSTTPFNYDAPVATDQGYMVLGPDGQPRLLINPATNKPFMKPPNADGGGNQETFGMSPEGGYDAAGNYVPFARTDRGRMVPLQMPPGYKYPAPVKQVDTGTGTAFVGPGGVETGPRIVKDVLNEALQAAVGKEEAAQLMAAPAAVATGTRFLAQLDALAADPNIERGTGLSSYFNFVRGSDGKSFQVKLDKAVGSAFLDAIKALQGTGAITDKEGGAATASVSGLDAGLDAPSFKKELEILRASVRAGLAKARKKAAKRAILLGEEEPAEDAPAAPASAGAPAAGAPAPGNYTWNGTEMVPAP